MTSWNNLSKLKNIRTICNSCSWGLKSNLDVLVSMISCISSLIKFNSLALRIFFKNFFNNLIISTQWWEIIFRTWLFKIKSNDKRTVDSANIFHQLNIHFLIFRFVSHSNQPHWKLWMSNFHKLYYVFYDLKVVRNRLLYVAVICMKWLNPQLYSFITHSQKFFKSKRDIWLKNISMFEKSHQISFLFVHLRPKLRLIFDLQ